MEKLEINIRIKLLCYLLLLSLFLTACTPASTGNNSAGDTKYNSSESVNKPDKPDENASSSATQIQPSSSDNTEPSYPSAQALEHRVLQKLSDMSIEEKVAQIFVVTPEAITGLKKVTVCNNATYTALRKYPVGGFIYFASNIVNPTQLKTMTEITQKYAKKLEGMPLFLSVDEEGGTVARIAGNTNFKVKKYLDMASIGATKDVNKAYQVGITISSYLHEYGLNLDFAPDADVLTSPSNKVIGKRSFGTDGKLVAEMALAEANGMAVNNVFSCFKHFPGHGATEGDTHTGLAYTNKTLDELKESELVPFKTAADNNIPFIMVSHISVPNITGDNTPSSLSKVVITDILRKQMGYNGIIITDSMSMGAIVNAYGTKDAVIRSIQAGADMILTPDDFKAAYQGVLEAVADGTVSDQRIDESLKRILKVKLGMTG